MHEEQPQSPRGYAVLSLGRAAPSDKVITATGLVRLYHRRLLVTGWPLNATNYVRDTVSRCLELLVHMSEPWLVLTGSLHRFG